MRHLYDRRRPVFQVPRMLNRVVRDFVECGSQSSFRGGRRSRFPHFVRMGEAWVIPGVDRMSGDAVGLPFLLIPTGGQWGPLTPDFDLPGVRPCLWMWLRFSRPALEVSRPEQIVDNIEACVERLLTDAQAYSYSNLWC